MEQRKKYISKEAALQKIQRFCAYQERCHKEVRFKLIELGIYGDDLEELMVSLIGDNFLNEERFAKTYARGKFRLKQWGKLRIIGELKARDISDYCIKRAMEEIDETEYVNTLRGIISKRKGLESNTLDAFSLYQKLAQYAISRGYEPDLVWRVINEKDEA
jgi:regulatory protein